MTIIQAIILGIAQGLAEFLPISSSGHLLLLQKIFGIQEGNMTFTILVHVATLIPVLYVYRDIIFSLIRRPFQKLTLFLILGTIPAVIVTLLFGDFIDELFSAGYFLAFGFIITGLFLIYADTVPYGRKKIKHMSGIDALIVGCLQAIAIAPGISRSGSTITASLNRQLDRETAAKFSFLLSVPAILGGAVLEVKSFLESDAAFLDGSVLPYIFGFIAAMVSGFFAINFMINIIKQCKLKYFSIYVFALAILILADQFILNLIEW